MLEDALQVADDYAALKAFAIQQAAELASTRLELAQSQTGLISATL